MLCAMDDISGRSTCFGDSGGPLLVGDAVTGWKVAGVTSWGLVCGSKISPSVFADVLALRSWIDSSPPPAPIRTGSVYISGSPRVGRSIHCVAQITGAAGLLAVRWTRAGIPISSGPSYRVRRARRRRRPWPAPSRRATPAARSRGIAAGRDRCRPRRRPPRAHARAARHPLHPAARRRRALHRACDGHRPQRHRRRRVPGGGRRPAAALGARRVGERRGVAGPPADRRALRGGGPRRRRGREHHAGSAHGEHARSADGRQKRRRSEEPCKTCTSRCLAPKRGSGRCFARGFARSVRTARVS